jgi:hypothetical protein
MINDEATTHEKQGTVGVQVEPLVSFWYPILLIGGN